MNKHKTAVITEGRLRLAILRQQVAKNRRRRKQEKILDKVIRSVRRCK